MSSTTNNNFIRFVNDDDSNNITSVPPPAHTIRGTIYQITSNWKVQFGLLGLLVLDVLLTITDLALDAEYPPCAAALLVCGLPSDHKCVDIPPTVTQFRSTIDIISNIILTIFVLEIALTAFAIGFFTYFRQPLLVFDSLVVGASVAVEIGIGRHNHHDTGLLVLGRAWRFIVIVHSLNELRNNQPSSFRNENDNHNNNTAALLDDDSHNVALISS
jgi:hypothetical protein